MLHFVASWFGFLVSPTTFSVGGTVTTLVGAFWKALQEDRPKKNDTKATTLTPSLVVLLGGFISIVGVVWSGTQAASASAAQATAQANLLTKTSQLSDAQTKLNEKADVIADLQNKLARKSDELYAVQLGLGGFPYFYASTPSGGPSVQLLMKLYGNVTQRGVKVLMERRDLHAGGVVFQHDYGDVPTGNLAQSQSVPSAEIHLVDGSYTSPLKERNYGIWIDTLAGMYYQHVVFRQSEDSNWYYASQVKRRDNKSSKILYSCADKLFPANRPVFGGSAPRQECPTLQTELKRVN